MSRMRERYHELVAEQKAKIVQINLLIDERSLAIIEGRTFSKRSEIAGLEYDIMAIDAAISKAGELSVKETANDGG